MTELSHTEKNYAIAYTRNDSKKVLMPGLMYRLGNLRAVHHVNEAQKAKGDAMQKSAMTRLACAAIIGGASLASNAAQTDLGPVSIGLPTSFQGAVIPAGDFSDIFTFSLPDNGGSGYSAMNFPVEFAGGGFNTVLSTMSLVSDPDGTPFTPDDALLTSVVAGPGGDLNLTWGPTSDGSFYLNITGIANGVTGGLYNGAISVSPVPEPEAWAMMLIGAGLVGFRLRNRSKRIAANRFA